MNSRLDEAIALDPADSPMLNAHSHAAFAQRLIHLTKALDILPDKPEETPSSALRALWLLAAGQPLSLHAASETDLPALDTQQLDALDALIARRIDGEPVAYLTGRQRFMGLELLASPEALIPRAESEMLARVAIEKLRDVAANRSAPPLAIDVCCGSGNLALALAHAVPQAQVHGADISPTAIDLARANTQQLGLNSRVQLHTGDLLAPFGEAFHRQVDLLVSLPPYISTTKMDTMPREIVGHEPHLAFDGGPFGVRILMRLIREAPPLLRPGGWLGMEVGLGQGPAMTQLLEKSPAYDQVETIVDAQGAVRAVLARAV
ncbi:peptide chain release factor N(5)-glutamine methyltransferase [Thiomonas bhubaneswarensis]|uniref:Protein-(Glutamine-N5) methyltransferase, release factor-specific n=1 Tax=Thiomonas bhubaneswarensis TaxID=339866 RepID=A0A0K6I712_9BURK|nr:peptide chain release factor N(5)-glutamine methyltransferase [Thiomonas bhubaneswarensis]CUA98886.1 protein-(glutamine-N5) methyltransferase, release factor-specific [Thiomonas bhubaneswarensis]